MKAELISIGDEILIGQVINTNSVFLAKELNNIGLEIVQITTISDQKKAIIQSLNQARKRADIIILTGGLGPTKDDITKLTLCDYFNDHLIKNPEILAHIESIFEKNLTTPINDLNRAQANLPSKALLLHNHFGTAAGLWFSDKKNIFISLPGIPYEMKEILKKEVIPRIKKQFVLPSIYHKTILTYGLGESAIAERIKNWENNLPDKIKLAYLPSLGRVRLRLSIVGDNPENIRELVDSEIKSVIPLIEDIYYGTEEDKPIEVLIANKLKKKRQSLSCAESCTGGAIATRFTANEGASNFFVGTAVTYSLKSKIELLDVSKKLIKKNGEVSAPVVEAMARGAKKRFKSDFVISTTGNAGPQKGDKSKDIGTVFIGLATPTQIISFKYNMGNSRRRVIQKTVNQALEILYQALLNANI